MKQWQPLNADFPRSFTASTARRSMPAVKSSMSLPLSGGAKLKIGDIELAVRCRSIAVVGHAELDVRSGSSLCDFRVESG
jgi:hypothetical protein